VIAVNISIQKSLLTDRVLSQLNPVSVLTTYSFIKRFIIRTHQKLLSSHLLSKNIKIGIYKTIILSVVLYACETWSLTLREEHRLRVFENRVLRRIFGPKKDELTGEWRKLHNEELRDLYSMPSIIRIIKSRSVRLAEHVARMREKRNAYRLLVGKPEGKRQVGRPRRRWMDGLILER
jgi:hypothetical protein